MRSMGCWAHAWLCPSEEAALGQCRAAAGKTASIGLSRAGRWICGCAEGTSRRGVKLLKLGGDVSTKIKQKEVVEGQMEAVSGEGCSEQQRSMEITAPERQGKVVHGLVQGSTNLAWDFLSGPALPGKWRQSSKGPGTGDVSI